ncbi:MAG: beta-mannosidase [Bacteroidales bacterium]|nr:beta-mannosidase [Bacteroidales bacterium]
MKKFSLLAVLLAAALAFSCKPAPKDQVLLKLQTIVDNGQVAYGHQDDLMYGHTWNATVDEDHALERSDVKSVTGDYPAILGLELGDFDLGSRLNLDGNDIDLTREAAVKHYERGGIVTLSWHPDNPATGESAWDVSGGNVVARLLPGGDLHDTWMVRMARITDLIESMKTADGTPIPIIWRPWHEHTGSWFWWGWDLCSDEEYNAFWVMTYDYMVKERGLKNLLWATSPNSTDDFAAWTARYPGDDYVDILGYDMYCPTWLPQPEAIPYYIYHTRKDLESLAAFAKEHGKVMAFTETGYEGLTHPAWWTEVLAPAIKDFPIAYVLTWRNSSEAHNKDTHFYAPFPGGPTEQDFCKFIKENKILLLNDIK